MIDETFHLSQWRPKDCAAFGKFEARDASRSVKKASRCRNNFRKLRAIKTPLNRSERSVTRLREFEGSRSSCTNVVDLYDVHPSISRSNEADLLVGERARRAVSLTNLTTWSGTTLRILTNRGPPPPPPVFLDRVSFSRGSLNINGKFSINTTSERGFRGWLHFVRSVIHPLLIRVNGIACRLHRFENIRENNRAQRKNAHRRCRSPATSCAAPRPSRIAPASASPCRAPPSWCFRPRPCRTVWTLPWILTTD